MLRQRPAHSERALNQPVQTRSASTIDLVAKRGFDLVVSSVLLILLSPLFALVAVMIKLDSRGSVFFAQERMGARWMKNDDGTEGWEPQEFQILKFRSMVQDADPTIHESHIRAFVNGTLEHETDEGNFKLDNDSRITRVGKLIRRTSIDELPQLINVVIGEMSLVGPRPVPIYEVEGYQPRHFERLHALPGITGYWQVLGRSQVSFEEMVGMDIWYVRNASFWLDLKIIALTLPAVLRGKGAA